MGLRTPEQFLSGLPDGREVYYRGQRVPDVTKHPELGVAARHAAIDFQLSEDPKLQAASYTARRKCGLFDLLPHPSLYSGSTRSEQADRDRHGS